MNSSARRNIFKRLNRARKTDHVQSFYGRGFKPKSLEGDERIYTLKSRMEAMRTEVHIIESGCWTDVLTGILKNKRAKDLLYPPGTDIGMALEKEWEKGRGSLPLLTPYGEDIEHFKPGLFKADASITTARCAIADPGAIVLWPDRNEPRTMSLVPPIHIAVLKKEKIFCCLSEAIIEEDWSEDMPSNIILISGPSKTADIELTLAYGVHGPKELILLIF